MLSCQRQVGVLSESCRGHVRVMSLSYRGHVRVKSNVGGYGTISNCVTFLVVFEAETGFSVLFDLKLLMNMMRGKRMKTGTDERTDRLVKLELRTDLETSLQIKQGNNLVKLYLL